MAHNLFSKLQTLRAVSKDTVGLEIWSHGGYSIFYGPEQSKVDFSQLASEGQIMAELDRLIKEAVEP